MILWLSVSCVTDMTACATFIQWSLILKKMQILASLKAYLQIYTHLGYFLWRNFVMETVTKFKSKGAFL